MRLPDSQNILISRLLELGKPVIVVLHNGSPVEMPWADKAMGIVEAYLGGEGVGEAVMNVLYGKVNPSGKLAESFPIRLEHNPSYINFPVARHKVFYGEGVFVGYRYYDTKKMDVLFPFGHGLSYTEFEYSNLRFGDGLWDEDSEIAKVNLAEDPDDTVVTVLVDVTNTGSVKGKEIVQLYVRDETGVINRPVHELKGFAKIELAPGETGTVSFKLPNRAFQWYCEEIHDWYAANGDYVIEIGKSSRDIVFETSIELSGSYQLPPKIDQDVQLGELLAYDKTKKYTIERFGKAQTQFAGSEKIEEMDEMTKAMLEYMPIRTLRSFGDLDNAKIEAILEELRKL
jgi:beta-glucosidase